MNESLAERLHREFQDKDYAEAYVDEFLNASIATQIKVIREQRGLSQQDLAALAQMKQERISVLENVNYGSWSIKTLTRIAHALDVTLKISFETYRTRIRDIAGFSRLSLERKTRVDELKNLLADQQPVAANSTAFNELLAYVKQANKTEESRSGGLDYSPTSRDAITDNARCLPKNTSTMSRAGATP